MGNTIIGIGILLVILGVVFNLLGRGGLPFLPGAIFIKKEGFTFYFPIVTSIILSIVLTFIARFLR